MDIRIDDLQGQAIADLLAQHLRDMYATSPAESVHALDINRLRQPDISFWSVWDQDSLAASCVQNKRQLGLPATITCDHADACHWPHSHHRRRP